MPPTQKKPSRLQTHLNSSDEELSPLHKSHSLSITPMSSLKSLPQTQSQTNIDLSENSSDSSSSRLSLHLDNYCEATDSISLEGVNPNSQEVTYFPPNLDSCEVGCGVPESRLALRPKSCDALPQRSDCDTCLLPQAESCDAHVPPNANRHAGGCDGNYSGKVPCTVRPEEIRRKKTKQSEIYHRKLQKYLLFRSDQHFLCKYPSHQY